MSPRLVPTTCVQKATVLPVNTRFSSTGCAAPATPTTVRCCPSPHRPAHNVRALQVPVACHGKQPPPVSAGSSRGQAFGVRHAPCRLGTLVDLAEFERCVAHRRSRYARTTRRSGHVARDMTRAAATMTMGLSPTLAWDQPPKKVGSPPPPRSPPCPSPALRSRCGDD